MCFDGVWRLRRGSGTDMPRAPDPFGSHQGSGACSRQARDPYVISIPARRAGTTTDDATDSTADLGSARDHLPDRSLAVGSSRADRSMVRGADSDARLQAVARRPRRYPLARDDADRVYRSGDSAVSAQAGRVWLLAHEYWLSAILTIIFAKFLGVGVAAF